MQLDPNEKNNNFYEIFEDKRVIKFLNKQENNKELLRRLENKYYNLSLNPYEEVENSFKSKKCPKCKKTRLGNYRLIYFIDENKKEIEIIDIGSRKNIYKKWD